jgi:hypothetical protein
MAETLGLIQMMRRYGYESCSLMGLLCLEIDRMVGEGE